MLGAVDPSGKDVERAEDKIVSSDEFAQAKNWDPLHAIVNKRSGAFTGDPGNLYKRSKPIVENGEIETSNFRFGGCFCAWVTKAQRS